MLSKHIGPMEVHGSLDATGKVAVEDLWRRARQALRKDGFASDPGLDLGWLNTPDPFCTQEASGSGASQPARQTLIPRVPGVGQPAEMFMPFRSAGQVANTLSDLLRAGAGAFATMMNLSPAPTIYQAILREPHERSGEVTTEEMLGFLSRRTATVFDARTRLEYAIGHIPGALSVAPKSGTPMSQYVSDVAEIARMVPDSASPVIVYCNGPFCGKSRRLADEMLNAGFTNVRRYQLGTPAWRALVGPMQTETEGIRYIQDADHTAVFVDARSPAEFAGGTFPGARNIPLADVITAKDDGRLPMDDFNTRVVTFGSSGTQALALAEALAQNGFNNMKFYGGTLSSLLAAVMLIGNANARVNNSAFPW